MNPTEDNVVSTVPGNDILYIPGKRTRPFKIPLPGWSMIPPNSFKKGNESLVIQILDLFIEAFKKSQD